MPATIPAPSAHDALAALASAFGVRPYVDQTGGGAVAIIATLDNGSQLWATGSEGDLAVPAEGECWVVGVYADADAVMCGDYAALAIGPDADPSTDALLSTVRRALSGARD